MVKICEAKFGDGLVLVPISVLFRWHRLDALLSLPQCTKSCGGGEQARNIQCMNTMTQQISDGCEASEREIDERTCNDEACPATSTGKLLVSHWFFLSFPFYRREAGHSWRRCTTTFLLVFPLLPVSGIFSQFFFPLCLSYVYVQTILPA